MQTGYQVKSQTESLSAMTIAFAQNSKDFQPPNDVFNLDPFACQLPLRLFFRFAQLMRFAVFLRQNHIQKLPLQTPIPKIGSQSRFFTEPQAAHLIQLVIVRVGLLEGDENSFLSKGWKPSDSDVIAKQNADEFTMADLLLFVNDISPIDGLSG